jgi:hypothetical protein
MFDGHTATASHAKLMLEFEQLFKKRWVDAEGYAIDLRS